MKMDPNPLALREPITAGEHASSINDLNRIEFLDITGYPVRPDLSESGLDILVWPCVWHPLHFWRGPHDNHLPAATFLSRHEFPPHLPSPGLMRSPRFRCSSVVPFHSA